MDATFYSILPSEDFFHGMDCQLLASKMMATKVEIIKFAMGVVYSQVYMFILRVCLCMVYFVCVRARVCVLR